MIQCFIKIWEKNIKTEFLMHLFNLQLAKQSSLAEDRIDSSDEETDD